MRSASQPSTAIRRSRRRVKSTTLGSLAKPSPGWHVFAPENRVESVALESFWVGRKSVDEYRIVASAAWPLRALAEREKTQGVDSLIGQCLDRSTSIINFGSRCGALFLIFQAVFPAGRRHWLEVLQALHRSATPPLHWRQVRSLRDAILIVGREDPKFAIEFCRGLSNPKTRRQAESRLTKSGYLLPREFFWR